MSKYVTRGRGGELVWLEEACAEIVYNLGVRNNHEAREGLRGAFEEAGFYEGEGGVYQLEGIEVRVSSRLELSVGLCPLRVSCGRFEDIVESPYELWGVIRRLWRRAQDD